jgi:uncharacterized protein YggE
MKITLLALASALAGACWAQIPARPASITAVGSATVSVTPDVARVDFSVVTQAATAQEASQQNATQAGTVISALQGFVASNNNIKTISYYVSPVYNNPAGQNSVIVGYLVSNTVQVTLTDLSRIGKAIDTAIQSGANRVQGISFDIQDRNPVIAQAIASGLNVHTGAVLHASEGFNTATPALLGAAATAVPTTPVETGLVVVQASVTLEVAITS